MSTTITTAPAINEVDARVPRFTASVTMTVLVTVLIVSAFDTRAAAVILAAQGLVFAIGAIAGPLRHPYGRIFTTLVEPRLSPATKYEPVPLLRFSQATGLIFAIVGVAGFLFGMPAVGWAATGIATFAAFMRAVFGICLSRRLFGLTHRLMGKGKPPCCQGK